jgi:hypothetical protein
MVDNANADINVNSTSLSDDLLWGVDAIAEFINRTRRQTFHLIETGQIPAGKTRGRIVASRTKVRARFAALVGGDV